MSSTITKSLTTLVAVTGTGVAAGGKPGTVCGGANFPYCQGDCVPFNFCEPWDSHGEEQTYCFAASKASRYGDVIGTDVYSFDSHMPKAAIHAGVVEENEETLVTVSCVQKDKPVNFVGTTRNGITSESQDVRGYASMVSLKRYKAATPAMPTASCGEAPVNGAGGHHFDLSTIPAAKFEHHVLYGTTPPVRMEYLWDASPCTPSIPESTQKPCKRAAFFAVQKLNSYCLDSYSKKVSGWTYRPEAEAAEATFTIERRGYPLRAKVMISCGTTAELKPAGDFKSQMTNGALWLYANLTSSVMCKKE